MAEVFFAILEGVEPLEFAAEAEGLPARVGPPWPNGASGAYNVLLRRITSGQHTAALVNAVGFVMPMTA